MKFTPIYQIQSLAGTDKLRDIAAVSEDTALGVEAALSSSSVPPAGSDLLSLVQRMNSIEAALDDQVGPWIDLAIPAGTGLAQYRRFFDMTQLRFHVSLNNSLAANGILTNLLTLPAGFRPVLATPLDAVGGTSAVASGSVSTDGSVILRNGHSSALATFSGAALYHAA